jgi:GH15 family glucan-1,4-alpha-glucosidase
VTTAGNPAAEMCEEKMMFTNFIKRFQAYRLRSLQYPTGLFGASSRNVKTGYNVAWIRDNIYEALGLEEAGNLEAMRRTYHALFEVFGRHEWKIDLAIAKKPVHAFEYIHPRYNPETLEELKGPWGNKQNDAIGAFLFKVGELYQKGMVVFRDENDIRLLQKLVDYLASIEYWQDKDNGMWEENEEIHASSLGACVAGLKAISPIVYVPEIMIRYGKEALNRLLPNESETKEVDLALLSLIYPFNVVNDTQKAEILWNVERKLVRSMGVIRYAGDRYYSNGKEAEWCFGFSWLAKIYKDMGNLQKHSYYMAQTNRTLNQRFEIPELYYAHTNTHNENSPLGWAAAMYIVAAS